MVKVTIRPANINEVKVLQNLNDEIFVDNYKYDPDLRTEWAQSEDGGKKYFTDLLNDSNSICLLAVVDQKIVGYIAAAPKEIKYRKSSYIEVENMGVTPEYRSQGIGNMLMDQCLGLAKEKGFQRVFVNAYSKNVSAIDFYKRKGFEEIDISLEKNL